MVIYYSKTMRADNRHYPGYWAERHDDGFRAFLDVFGGNNLLNLKTRVQKMEVKFVMFILAGGGFASWIAGIIANWHSWKSDLLFVLGATFMLVKICVYIAKSWQDYRYREWHLKEKERESEE